jgi:membrane-bound serine protease (ClpP class)
MDYREGFSVKEPKPDKSLIGKIAIVSASLSPSGSVEIEGEVYEAIAQEGNIDTGRGVRVTGIKGKRLLVHLV